MKAALRKPGFLAGAAILLFWAVCALLGPAAAPLDPYADDLWHTLAPPSAAHWFGTDAIGRDVFARVISGARPVLSVAPAAVALAAIAGTSLGVSAAYFGGAVDLLAGQAIGVVLSLPLIVVALFVLTALGPSRLNVVLVIAAIFTPLIARAARAAARAECGLDYVTAARLQNEGALYIMTREILPNIAPALMVEVTVRLGYAVFTVASLSFLGFGVQPPSPDWGLAVAENYGLIAGGYWWTVVFPAGATASLVVAVNLIAAALERTEAQ